MYSAMNLTLGRSEQILSRSHGLNLTCLHSVSGFLPTIIKGLGYTDADAQLVHGD
jgi:hypothetical protein